jgi:hypothetical protein
VRWFVGTVEETLNAMLDAEADRLCGGGRFAAGSRAHHKRNRDKTTKRRSSGKA